jgi:hypothetical protein
MYVGFLDDASFRWSAGRGAAFDQARHAHASVLRTIVRWSDVAPRRPTRAASPWDRAYRFDDLDEFMRRAQQRGIEVLLTLWGTPSWANGGQQPNVPPTDPSDLRAFAHAVADRYSGRYAGYPFGRFFAIWNEPNSPRFLAADEPAATYAALAEAAILGVKSASPQALVALGETAARHAPASFAEEVARARPNLQFDAWAHHPYPPGAGDGPDVPAEWPDVGLGELDRFGRALDAAFGRTELPLWVSEYAESTTAVSEAEQAAHVERAIAVAAALERTQMFVWLMLRDHVGEPWQSGLVGKAAFGTFAAAAQRLDARNARVEVDPGAGAHVVRVPALELRWHLPAREGVGVRYTLSVCGRRLASATAGGAIEATGWVPVRVVFRARAAVRYRLDVRIEDVHGFRVRRTVELVSRGAGSQPRATC